MRPENEALKAMTISRGTNRAYPSLLRGKCNYPDPTYNSVSLW